MSVDREAFQAMLAGMRQAFLEELPERCDRFEQLILELERDPGDRERFKELYRGVHSLKGSGGTHGLGIITSLCHQLEDLLNEIDAEATSVDAFTSQALAYVDLLRQVRPAAQQPTPDFSAIERALEQRLHASLQDRKLCLVAESSLVMASLYQKALEPLLLHLTVVDDGPTALLRLLKEPFDLVIVGGELKDLNGIAVIAALRASDSPRQGIPAILVSSKGDSATAQGLFSQVLPRDKALPGRLLSAVRGVLTL